MQKYLFLLIAGLINVSVMAQRTINGVVKDADKNMPLAGVTILQVGTSKGIMTSSSGRFSLRIPNGEVKLRIAFKGYIPDTVMVGKDVKFVTIPLKVSDIALKDVVIVMHEADAVRQEPVAAALYGSRVSGVAVMKGRHKSLPLNYAPSVTRYNTEDYSPISENSFHAVNKEPLSTFSIDVDRASYSNIRRYLNNGILPPADAIRVEEMVNYFDYQYKKPAGKDPVAIYTDMARCPWDTSHQLVRIALKGREVPSEKLPPANLVFLLDVSGSMEDDNKLPLVKQALKVLVNQLRPEDRVAIVVYAGAAGVVLPSTKGSERTTILDALENLQAGGSTAGGEGIQLAYKTAAEHLLKAGNNRVILATDGDFNVGASSDGELQKLIEKKRGEGIFLTVLGFGMGNLKDNKLELLADKGNGHYAYIDNFEEARRTFVTEFGGTLFTIAKDVKLQVEFNPRFVQGYRLIGYENRMLENEDFNNDKKDAGDMGAGHTVTALYEIIPTGTAPTGVNWTDPLKYQEMKVINAGSNEVLTVKMRYKLPAEETSQLFTKTMHWEAQDIGKAPEDFRMASAVAAFGMLLRNSEHKGQASYDQVLAIANGARGEDKEGYRAEFIQLVKKAMVIKN